jgi:hypothetical protein
LHWLGGSSAEASQLHKNSKNVLPIWRQPKSSRTFTGRNEGGYFLGLLKIWNLGNAFCREYHIHLSCDNRSSDFAASFDFDDQYSKGADKGTNKSPNIKYRTASDWTIYGKPY